MSRFILLGESTPKSGQQIVMLPCFHDIKIIDCSKLEHWHVALNHNVNRCQNYINCTQKHHHAKLEDK